MAVPEQQDERRRRRRAALLWSGSVTVVLLLVALGLVGLERSNRDDRSRPSAGGPGSAPVYDRMPEAEPEPASPKTTETPTNRPPDRTVDTNSRRSTPTSSTDSNAGAAGLDGERPARRHGIALVLTSTLSAPLKPGLRRTLRVSVRNPNAFAVDLQRLDVRVGTPPAAGCSQRWVRVERFRAPADTERRVGGRATIVVNLPIELIDLATVDQNACQGSTFPLTLSGIAVDAA